MCFPGAAAISARFSTLWHVSATTSTQRCTVQLPRVAAQKQTDSAFSEPSLLHINSAKEDVLPLAEHKIGTTMALLVVHEPCPYTITAVSTVQMAVTRKS